MEWRSSFRYRPRRVRPSSRAAREMFPLCLRRASAIMRRSTSARASASVTSCSGTVTVAPPMPAPIAVTVPGGVFSARDDALNLVAELAHVSRPFGDHQQIDCLWLDLNVAAAKFRRIVIDVVIDDRGNL